MSLTPYISMKWGNEKLFTSRSVGDNYIFLFDIDETLYQMNDEMRSMELKLWKEAFDHFKSKESEINFEDLIKGGHTNGKEILKILDIPIRKLEDYRNIRDFSEYIKENKELRNLLESIKYPKWCFTNGIKKRAEAILKTMGLENVFDGVICLDDDSMCEIAKPDIEAYKFVEKMLGIVRKEKVIFFDDSVYNVETGRVMGWKSILVNKEDDIVSLIRKELSEISETLER